MQKCQLPYLCYPILFPSGVFGWKQTPEKRKLFCKLVYLFRKRGYTVKDSQEVAYKKILEDSVPFDAGKQVC
jgi:hypothetical protein